MSQTEDMYPFDLMYEHEQKLYTFHQNDLTNYQWYEKFNTWSEVANTIRVTRQHKVLLDNEAKGKNSDSFEKITGD